MQKNYNAGIYCQLSREDERSGKLVSVENQKIMLERYVHTGVDPLARDRELDMLFERLYEDNVSGKIDDARFAKMSKRYEQEQGENAGRIKALRLEPKKLEDKRMDVDTFLETVRRYTDATTHYQAHGCRAHSVHRGLSGGQGGRHYQSAGDDPLQLHRCF